MKKRLIIVPQLPVKLRYQEWWPNVLKEHLGPAFDETIILGQLSPIEAPPDAFSLLDASIRNELMQVNQFIELNPGKDDTLLHCDLSFPGIFHSCLYKRRLGRKAVFCHATAKNRYDFWAGVRRHKWRQEVLNARLYDVVFVATCYHAHKLRKHVKTKVLHGLPDNPWVSFQRSLQERCSNKYRRFCSVARPCMQKVNKKVEQEIFNATFERVERPVGLRTWMDYSEFLARSEFLVVTSREETYGYQVVDAVNCGCIPIVPNAFSYPEIVPARFRYDPRGTPARVAEEILHVAARLEGQKPELLVQTDNVYERMLEALL